VYSYLGLALYIFILTYTTSIYLYPLSTQFSWGRCVTVWGPLHCCRGCDRLLFFVSWRPFWPKCLGDVAPIWEATSFFRLTGWSSLARFFFPEAMICSKWRSSVCVWVMRKYEWDMHHPIFWTQSSWATLNGLGHQHFRVFNRTKPSNKHIHCWSPWN
jgi:hypothetical protein